MARHVGPDATARGAEEAALVVLDDEGAVRALVGGRSLAPDPLQPRRGAHRQPGSAFKAFVFLAALEAGLEPETVFQDKPVRYGSWQPRNNTGKYRGAGHPAGRLRPLDQHGGRPGRQTVSASRRWPRPPAGWASARGSTPSRP